MVYICSSSRLLALGWRDFCQVEKEIAVKSEKIDKMTIIFTQNNNFGLFSVKVIKTNKLQYNMLGRWVDRHIDQVYDGPSIILIDWK